jgi:hypothetical protein
MKVAAVTFVEALGHESPVAPPCDPDTLTDAGRATNA